MQFCHLFEEFPFKAHSRSSPCRFVIPASFSSSVFEINAIPDDSVASNITCNHIETNFWILTFCFSLWPWLIGDEMDVDRSRVSCPNCQRSYKSKKLVYRHLRAGCGQVAYGWREGESCNFPVFRCQLCPYMAFTRGFLDKHNQTEHRESFTYDSLLPHS